MRYLKFPDQSPIRALDARWFFAALPRVRARLAELRAARFATPTIDKLQIAIEPRAVLRVTKVTRRRGRAPIICAITTSEDEP